MNNVLKKILLGSVGCLFLMPLFLRGAMADDPGAPHPTPTPTVDQSQTENAPSSGDIAPTSGIVPVGGQLPDLTQPYNFNRTTYTPVYVNRDLLTGVTTETRGGTGQFHTIRPYNGTVLRPYNVLNGGAIAYTPSDHSTEGNWTDRGGPSSTEGMPDYSTQGNWTDRGGPSSTEGMPDYTADTSENLADNSQEVDNGVDKSLEYMGDGIDSTTAVAGYVEAVKEIPVADYEQLLLLNITYTDESSMEASEKISDKIKKYTGFEGDIGLDNSFNPASFYLKSELSPSDQLADILAYNQLMLIADAAAKDGNTGAIYNAYVTYNSGLYKENVLRRAREAFYKNGNVDYANYVNPTGGGSSVSDEREVMGRTVSQVLDEFNSSYQKYQQFVIESSKGFGYAVSLPTVYGDLDLFPLFATEYAFFKYEAANANYQTIDEMKLGFEEFILKGGAKDRGNINARRNIFEAQALAGVFSNSITIREIAQRYINSKADLSALGTKANNDRSNWYASNILTSGLVQILAWDAVLDASMLEYDGIKRIKLLDNEEVK